MSEWRKPFFAHFERLIVYFAKQHFSQEWSIFEGNQHFWKRRQNSNDCDVIRLNRVNPKLWRTILASEDASEKTFLTNTSKSCWKTASEKKTWIRRIVQVWGNEIIFFFIYLINCFFFQAITFKASKNFPIFGVRTTEGNSSIGSKRNRHFIKNFAKVEETPNLAWFRNF